MEFIEAGTLLNIRPVFKWTIIYLVPCCIVFFAHCTSKDRFNETKAAACVSKNMYVKLPKGLISLTYDDGPGPATLKLAKYLHEQNICATFFVVGNSDVGGGYKNYPYLDSLVFYGQRIGSHTYNHKDLRTLSCEEAKYQLIANQSFITPVIKNNLCYFTPPWFSWSDEVAKCLQADPSLNGIRGPIGMDFDTHDYLYRNNPKPELCAQAFISDPVNKSKFDHLVGGVIKMHDFNSYSLSDFALEETKTIVSFLKSKGYIFVPPTLEFSPAITNLERSNEFTNDKYWSSDISYYGTIRLGDVTGDQMADIICRKENGIYVAKSNGLGFDSLRLWTVEFSDALGWKSADYSPTLQVGDVNGDAKSDLIIQSRKGVKVALSSGTAFQSSTIWSDQFKDVSEKDGDYSCKIIMTADVNADKKNDIVIRRQDGIYVGLSLGTRFDSLILWTKEFPLAILKDKKYKKGLTTELADVNGDGSADIVTETANGIAVALSTGSGFREATVWVARLSNSSLSNNSSIRLGDVNGDNIADLLVRGNEGIHVLLSNGNAFMNEVLWNKAEFVDQITCNLPPYNVSFQCGDINGDKRADFIFRNKTGIYGAVSP